MDALPVVDYRFVFRREDLEVQLNVAKFGLFAHKRAWSLGTDALVFTILNHHTLYFSTSAGTLDSGFVCVGTGAEVGIGSSLSQWASAWPQPAESEGGEAIASYCGYWAQANRLPSMHFHNGTEIINEFLGVASTLARSVVEVVHKGLSLVSLAKFPSRNILATRWTRIGVADTRPKSSSRHHVSPQILYQKGPSFLPTRLESYAPITASELKSWLIVRPEIASAITFTNAGATIPILDWQSGENPPAFWLLYLRLLENFQLIAQGATSLLVSDPPVQQRVMGDAEAASPTWLSEEQAVEVFAANLAVQLFVELRKIVPWSVDESLGKWHASNSLAVLFSSSRMFQQVDGGFYSINDHSHVFNLPNSSGDLTFPLSFYATPCDSLYALRFLLNNDLIGESQSDTVNRVMSWMFQLIHTFFPESSHSIPDDYKSIMQLGPQKAMASALFHEYTWGYRGLPPIRRILDGTMNPLDWEVQQEWAEGATPALRRFKGCSGSTAFLHWLLRTIGIPVDYAYMYPGEHFYTGHSQAWFPTIEKFLVHSDDPYVQFLFSFPPAPASTLPVHCKTFVGMFTGTQCGQNVAMLLKQSLVGARIAQLCAEYLPVWLLRHVAKSGALPAGLQYIVTSCGSPGNFNYALTEEHKLHILLRAKAKIASVGGPDIALKLGDTRDFTFSWGPPSEFG